MILNAIIICVFLAGARSEFTNVVNHIVKERQIRSAPLEKGTVRESECQYNQSLQYSDAWIATFRLCANNILERTLFIKLAWNAQVIASWNTSATHECALGNLGKTHFTNIVCEKTSQSNLIVLTISVTPSDKSLTYYKDMWMCGGEAKTFGGNTRYFSKWSEDPVCYRDDEQKSGIQESVKMEQQASSTQAQDVPNSPQPCVQCIYYTKGENGSTSLNLNVSCQKEIVQYCLMKPGKNARSCCDKGMLDWPGILNCYRPPVKGPIVTEVLINDTLFDLLESRVQVTLNDSTTYNLNCTENVSSSGNSLENGSASIVEGAIGGSFGGLVLLVSIVIIGLRARRHRQQRRPQKQNEPRDDSMPMNKMS